MPDVTLNLRVDGYTNRVLGVVKEMFGLRDKSEALRKFVEMNGDSILEREVSEDVVRSVISTSQAHIKKHGMRKMSLKELDELTGL